MAKYNRITALPYSFNRGSSIEFGSKTLYNNDMSKYKLLTIAEVTEILRVSKSTLYRYLNAQILPALKLDGRTMIRDSDLQAFIDSRSPYVGRMNEI